MKFLKRHLSVIGASLTIGVLASGCAGGVGPSTDSEGGGDGYEFGASPEEIQEALADMPETTLTYQPPANGPQDLNYYREENFKKSVEELSGGKITLEIVHGRAVANYPEVPDALIDGRLDLAFAVPLYTPGEFPVAEAFVTGSALAGTSPLVDELASNAALTQLAWDSPELINEFEERGLNVLVPINPAGSVFTLCADPLDGDMPLGGEQVNSSSEVTAEQVQALGGTPTSMEYTEIYDAISRGTVDCTTSALLPSVTSGFIEVAPHLAFSSATGFARGPGAILAGPSFEQLPLAAQQLIFDQMGNWFRDSRGSDLDGAYEAVKLVREYDGSITELSEENGEVMQEATRAAVQEHVDAGEVSESFAEDIDSNIDYWRGVAEELGYTDEGSFQDFDSWYVKDDDEYLQPFSDRVYEEVMLPQRPT